MQTQSKPMSPKQFGFITALIIERADVLGIEANATSAEAWMFAKRASYTSQDASFLIERLKSIHVEKPSTPTFDLSHTSIQFPTRVISNRYARACDVCGHRVEESAGLAVQSSGKWSTVHMIGQCVEPYIGKAKKNAEDHVRLYVTSRLSRIVPRTVYFALESHTGNNDLDFYALIVDGDEIGLKRVIGGSLGDVTSNSPVMSKIEATRVCDIVEQMTDDQWEIARLAFASSLGRCCFCNRTLTDDASRARGMGIDCAERHATF